MYLYDDTHKYFEFPLLFWKAIKDRFYLKP